MYFDICKQLAKVANNTVVYFKRMFDWHRLELSAVVELAECVEHIIMLVIRLMVR